MTQPSDITMKRPSEFEGIQPAQRTDIQPLQGWGTGITPTQGCTLGCGIQPLRGLRQSHTGSLGCRPHIKGPAGDADVVSIDRGFGKVSAFVDSPEVPEGARLRAKTFCGVEAS